LPLPEGVPTFGYQTAREIGAQLVKNLSEDAKTTRRWYFVIMMGRTAGHLALGVGKSAGATVTIIPEEFPGPVPLATIADILATSMIKRQAMGKPFGVAVIAEGLAERLTQEDLKFLENVERDAHGHVRLSEVDFGEIVKQATKKVLDECGIKTSIVDKEIGYELRCAPPVAFDVEYTRNLGYAAVKFLLDGGSKAMISIQGERIVPMPFDEIRDPKTGKTSVRRVNIESLQYQIAQKYMIKLNAADLADAGQCAKLAAAAGMTPEAFKKRFGHLTAGS
jgi:6-phosphofructokinase 1